MKGFPKHFNTKQDVMVSLENWPDKTRAELQKMIDSRFSWLIDRKLADGESGIEDDTHKIKEVKDEETGEVVERYQMEWKEDPNCKLYRLGFTKQGATDCFKANLCEL